MSKVKIVGASNATPNQIVARNPNKPDYGYIRVESVEETISGGWLRTQKRSALINGLFADLERMAQNLQIGKEMPGKIVVKESLTPFYEGQQPKRTNSNADGVVLFKVVNGVEKPIYRTTEYTSDMTVEDVLIEHDNVLSAAARQAVGENIAVK